MEMVDSFSHFLTWTLIHSFWIAAAAMLLARIGGSVTGKAYLKGRIRFISLIAFLVATCIFVVFKMDFQPTEQFGVVISKDSGMEIIEMGWIHQMKIWISSRSHFISLFWLIGAIFSFIRYYIGFYRIKQVRRFSHDCKHEELLGRINEIRQELNIRARVELRISSLVNSPLTSGWLKPVIYLPIGMTTGFSMEEIDTILYHEMVHIKRHDYLINLILACFETLFFFNPFVLMMIKDLRSDMEYACDDQVIKHNSKATYVHALLKLQELRLSNALGLAAKSSNSEFIKRINKMMNNTNNSNEKSKLIPGLIICLLLVASIMGSAFISRTDDAEKVTLDRTSMLQSQDTVRANSKEELGRKLKNLTDEERSKVVVIYNGEEIKLISDTNLKKGETMMKHIKKELVRDGILSKENSRVRLMFQYSDLLNGKEVLGDKYPKYKKIFNTYFPVYDSYATTRVFKYED